MRAESRLSRARPAQHAKPSGAPAEGFELKELPVDDFTTDKAFFAALKLHVYGTVHDQFLTTLIRGKSLVLDQELKLEVARFTSRKANHLFVSESGQRAGCSAEFYGFTSHKVREKLAQLHELGVVELLGKGLRDAYTYRWKVPLKHWEICSFMRFRRATDTDLSLNLELYRLFQSRGTQPFTAREFHETYAAAHGQEYTSTRWGARKWEKIASSFAYGEFLKGRLELLAKHNLVAQSGDAYQLAPATIDSVNHFDLFLNGVAYRASRAMCDVCPLDALCQAGSTQKLIVSINAQ